MRDDLIPCPRAHRSGQPGTVSRAALLDRDGVVIMDTGYVASPEEVKLIPGAARAIRELREQGWRVAVVTNQSGVARGLITEEDLERINTRMEELLAAEGAELDALYYCPHHPKSAASSRYLSACPCRKPAPGLLRQAALDLAIDLRHSWLVGDKPSDIAAGQAAGCRTVLVGDHPDARAAPEMKPDVRAPSLLAALPLILGSG